MVSSVQTGEALFSRNPDAPLRPASTQKLFTTALAFERLGVHHQFTTEVLHDGTVGADGTLRGSLVLRGGGDPSLSSRFYGSMPEAPARALAKLVAAAGIRRVSGDVIGDASAFDDKGIPDGWLARYLHDSYAARVSALSLNGNLLHVAVAPGKAGGRAIVTLRPALSGIAVINTTTTRANSRIARIVVSRRADGTVVASGSLGARAGIRVYTVVVEHPADFTTRAFHQALENEGITIEGKPRLGTPAQPGTRLGALTSPPLYQLASHMNGESDNHFAELIFRNASRGDRGTTPGSAALANRQLRDLLSEYAGVPPNAVSAADGSGLSSWDRATPRSLAQLLSFAHRAPWANEFHLSLPIAGQSETLRRRMIGTAAQGNLHAKTGTTSDVVSLAGYVTSRSGELLSFSFLYNGRERSPARETIDAMGATLAGWTR
jgi:D-alanyl-D-alanine carboxypeptidase/D-alanyl-D-alanine-endopeptidase (penicillin-binding protein 4)